MKLNNVNIKKWQHSEECMCRLRNIAMRDYQESVTTGETGRRTDKGIPMCRYASQKHNKMNLTLCVLLVYNDNGSLQTLCT